MKRIVIAAAAAAALLATTAATPQDQWTQQVRRMLVDVGKRWESDGFELTHQIYTGSLRNGAGTDVRMQLDIGTDYRMLGACDTDCSDLDLVLYDPAGNEVDSDLEMDDFPIVDVTPRRSGTYRVHVTMATCTTEPCRYGIGVFGK